MDSKRDRLLEANAVMLDCLARLDNVIDSMQMFVEKHRDVLSEDKTKAVLDDLAARRAINDQRRKKCHERHKRLSL